MLRNLFPAHPPLPEAPIEVCITLQGQSITYGCLWFSLEEHDYLLYNNLVEDFGVCPTEFNKLENASIVATKDLEVMHIRFNKDLFKFQTI
jgi:hypothetical protein